MNAIARSIVLGALILATNATYLLGVFMVLANEKLMWPVSASVAFMTIASSVYWFTFHDELLGQRNVHSANEGDS